MKRGRHWKDWQFWGLSALVFGGLVAWLWRVDEVQSTPDFVGTDVEVMEAVTELNEALPDPPGLASDLAVMRRMGLALLGTIPSLEEIRAFEAESPEVRLDWWLEQVLRDRRFSDHLAERLARALVGTEDGPFLLYRRGRFVNWLSDEILAGRAYDEVVRGMIAAEGVWTTHPPVNFLTFTVDGEAKPAQVDPVKLTTRFSRAFLGLRLDCVQCHDDLLGDRWEQTDFHQLAAFFGEAELGLTGIREDAEREYAFRYPGKRDEERVPALVPFLPELLPAEGTRRERLAGWVTHPENGAFSRATVNRIWAVMFGEPLVEPVDDLPLEGPWPGALTALAEAFTASGYDLYDLIRVIAKSEAFRAAGGSGPQAFPMTRLRPHQVAHSVIQASSVQTLDRDAHLLRRLGRLLESQEFVEAFGDPGEGEFEEWAGTITQRLLMMNGEMVDERTEPNFLMNAATRIGALAGGDAEAVRTAYLTVLTRLPSERELAHFRTRLEGHKGEARSRAMADLFWALINSTEFSWNH